MDRSGWDFSKELAAFGPDSQHIARPLSLADAEAYCRYVARTHYENFQITNWLVPQPLRQDLANIYAYCRWADDCADEAASVAQATSLLSWWRRELESLFPGEHAEPSRHPVMQALAVTIVRHSLPRAPFLDLISAFQQDQVKRRYDTDIEVLDYCRRSANPVGRLVLGLGQVADDAEHLRLSDQVCTGLQLANFCQDMARDAAIDRIYAPKDLWKEFEVSEQMILNARPTAQLQAMLGAWVARACEQLVEGRGLTTKKIPRWLALDVRLFCDGGLAILQEIEKARFNVWTRRPTVSRARKLQLFCRALPALFIARFL